ncbi:Oxygen-dependent coproporphyrinogen-III oxidase, chloroplastic [Smittium mucronatum]|uniref:coproporphyrinogen oxidase n=1 Tax=Smittium mucronatum TaxID=133383 RepID=A0A1R0GR46_9FUNG|nr:Oxygen-dependent coproporphyrinogen-III oxidase, chloroplastic [Smittium mucronatum]
MPGVKIGKSEDLPIMESSVPSFLPGRSPTSSAFKRPLSPNFQTSDSPNKKKSEIFNDIDKPVPIEYSNHMQARICSILSRLDGNSFSYDRWERQEGGYGITRVLQDGKIFEKSCVNVSVIEGNIKMQSFAKRKELQLEEGVDYRFKVSGLSIAIHPNNPFAPSTHANYRYFELFRTDSGEDSGPVLYWFGGGADLNPAYVIDEDATFFHMIHKRVCDKYDHRYYPTFKKWCDEYFYLPNRDELRGVGGIFFDDLDNRPAEQLFEFVKDAAKAFLLAYIPILSRRIKTPFTKKNKEWQLIRRGRSVEFNLCFDRGTRFGISASVRTESILSSLPLNCIFHYNFTPQPGSLESLSLEVLRTPREWV